MRFFLNFILNLPSYLNLPSLIPFLIPLLYHSSSLFTSLNSNFSFILSFRTSKLLFLPLIFLLSLRPFLLILRVLIIHLVHQTLLKAFRNTFQVHKIAISASIAAALIILTTPGLFKIGNRRKLSSNNPSSIISSI